jgi:Nif-specific regulatory protein
MTAAVAGGSFREDLFYRLHVFTIALPPLRSRRVDVPPLTEYFLEEYSRKHRRGVRRIASGAMDLLCQYDWPGNVRELENAIERAVVVCEAGIVEERHLPKAVRTTVVPPEETGRMTLGAAVARLERQMIEEALRESGGNLARASRTLGTTERILRYKVNKYGLGGARSPRRR